MQYTITSSSTGLLNFSLWVPHQWGRQ